MKRTGATGSNERSNGSLHLIGAKEVVRSPRLPIYIQEVVSILGDLRLRFYIQHSRILQRETNFVELTFLAVEGVLELLRN